MYLNVQYSRNHPAEWPHRLSILLARKGRVIYGKIPSTKGEAMGAVDSFIFLISALYHEIYQNHFVFSQSPPFQAK